MEGAAPESATANADAAAAAASGAAASAAAAEQQASAATGAAESAEREAAAAAAAVEHVAESVQAVGANVAAAAEAVTETAIENAVAEIEAEIEEENTWLATQLLEVKQKLDAIQSQSQPSSELTKMMESLLSRLAKLEEKLTPAPATPESGSGEGQEVPPTPPAATRNKRRRI